MIAAVTAILQHARSSLAGRASLSHSPYAFTLHTCAKRSAKALKIF